MGAVLFGVERGGCIVKTGVRIALWIGAVFATISVGSVFGVGDLVGNMWLFAAALFAAIRLTRLVQRRRFVRSWQKVGLGPAVLVLTDRSRWWAICSSVGLERTSDRWMSGTGRKAVPTRVRVFPTVGAITPAAFGATVRVRGVDGQALSDWARLASPLATALRVPAITVMEPSPGVFELALRTHDPLGTPFVLNAPVPADAGIWGLPLGINESGQWVELPLANVSGVLVGGTPGSGKSAWLGFALSGFVTRQDVELQVIDGRGGHDHDSLAPRCSRYIAGDESHDLDVVVDALRAVRELMRERISRSVELYGHHNLWSVGPSAWHPAIFIVLDEFQAYMPNQFSSKLHKDTAAEIIAIATDLVKRGRSAGIVLFLLTQRPTTDAIPSALRDNCGNRICFSVMNRDSAEAVLGTHSTDTDISPIRQPAGIAVTVVDGDFSRFRAPLIPADILSEYVLENTIQPHFI